MNCIKFFTQKKIVRSSVDEMAAIKIYFDATQKNRNYTPKMKSFELIRSVMCASILKTAAHAASADWSVCGIAAYKIAQHITAYDFATLECVLD